jgi:alpha-ribazole phosphatase
MGVVWMVRHAPVTVSGICYGRLDVPTECDAETAASRIERAARQTALSWQRIWASPSARAREVGAEIATRLRVPFHVDDRLCELDFGAWEGRSYLDLEREAPERFARWLSHYETEGPPGGESFFSLRRRVGEWLRERRLDDTITLAVTHAGVMRTARALATGTTYGEQCERPVDHLVPEPAPWPDGFLDRMDG